LFLWPDPASCLAPEFLRHRALWSADFPRSCKQDRDRPANLSTIDHTLFALFRQFVKIQMIEGVGCIISQVCIPEWGGT